MFLFQPRGNGAESFVLTSRAAGHHLIIIHHNVSQQTRTTKLKKLKKKKSQQTLAWEERRALQLCLVWYYIIIHMQHAQITPYQRTSTNIPGRSMSIWPYSGLTSAKIFLPPNVYFFFKSSGLFYLSCLSIDCMI